MPENLTEVMQAFETFKARNEELLAGKGSVEAVNKANEAVTALQTKLTEAENKAAEDRANFEALETEVGRLKITAASTRRTDDGRAERYAAWQSAVLRKPVDPANVDYDFQNTYNAALNDYLRHGREGAQAESMRVLNAALAGDNASGGYWVDPDTNGRMVQFFFETSPIRQRANVQIASGDKLEGKVMLGEAGSGWVGETESRPETDSPTVGEWEIPLREQYAAPRATQRLIDQASINIPAWIEAQVRGKLARDEATAFVTGNTPKRPRGFTTYDAGTPGSTAATWPFVEQVNSGAAATLTADGLHALVAAMKEPYLRNASFGMRRATELVVRQMKDGNGNYLWQPDFSAPAKGQLLGYPVDLMADMPAIAASAEPIVFADFFEAYQIADSPTGLRVLVDPYTAKPYVIFYTTRYVGGDVVNFEAIKLQTVSA